ncbi:MAG: class I SAM-dependent rRNA methyltransferase [Gemmataceae bacterium]|nr:class I SAM-dependent rRNA methyltransferase [Gemmataceae bacterium]
MSLPRVILKPKRARPFFGRHPWVFAGAVAEVQGEPADGAVVDLVSHAGNFIARGLYNSRSKIRVRLYSWDSETALDESFFRERLARAIALRRDVLGLGGPGRACRLVFSEADSLSGLTVDQYDRWLVLQFTSLALAQRREMFADLLMSLLTAGGQVENLSYEIEGIYLRTERGIGQLEGLELHDGPLRGHVPQEPIVIEENSVRFGVLLTEGQKTGFYLDQRDNRQAVAKLAKGRRVLDAFCYSGGFGLHAAKAGAASVLGVDASEPALELARGNARLNELDNIAFEKHDVFDKLDALVDAGERFGLVILDPPKFARAGHAVEEAMRGYRQLQTQAIKLLEAGGILVVCCCSGLITRDMLHDLLAQLAAEHKRDIQILESRGPSGDHPTAVTCPETDYLKCIICRLA